MTMKGYRRFKRGLKKGVKTTFAMANTALNTALKVKKLLNVEFKRHDIPPTNASVDNTSGQIISLNHMAQGTTAKSRNGNSIRARGLALRYIVEKSSAAGVTGIRVMLILDKSPNSTKATLTEIFENTNVLGQVPADETKYRFKVLFDETHMLDNEHIQGTFRSVYRSMNHVVKYDGADATENGMNQNQLLLVAISNQPTNTPNIDYSTRFTFIDN